MQLCALLIAGGKIAVEEAGEILFIAFITLAVVPTAEFMLRHDELVRF